MINEKKCSLKLQYEASILPITVVYDTLTFLHNSANWRIARSERQHLWHVICSIDEPWCISNWTGGANKHYNHKRRKNMLSVQDWNIGQDCWFSRKWVKQNRRREAIKKRHGPRTEGDSNPAHITEFRKSNCTFSVSDCSQKQRQSNCLQEASETMEFTLNHSRAIYVNM